MWAVCPGKSVQLILSRLNTFTVMLDTILWATDGPQKKVFLRLRQPVTATQISRKTGISADTCSYVLGMLSTFGLTRCLNPYARRSRLYWLTRLGKAWQRRLRELDCMPPLAHDCPDLDWTLYGDVCFSHRASVVRTLTHPMQPAEIKRRAVFQNPKTRMSANNVRDVIRFLRSKGIVRPVKIRRRAYPRYELTDTGKHMQRLLLQAEVRA